ncbi:MAG: hypothetical protein H3C62_05690 [Gemmatimonadaceae bacterium]|nr:hypothetical protein [Gemmatimonadaceae bacterium]
MNSADASIGIVTRYTGAHIFEHLDDAVLVWNPVDHLLHEPKIPPSLFTAWWFQGVTRAKRLQILLLDKGELVYDVT